MGISPSPTPTRVRVLRPLTARAVNTLRCNILSPPSPFPCLTVQLLWPLRGFLSPPGVDHTRALYCDGPRGATVPRGSPGQERQAPLRFSEELGCGHGPGGETNGRSEK